VGDPWLGDDFKMIHENDDFNARRSFSANFDEVINFDTVMQSYRRTFNLKLVHTVLLGWISRHLQN
jgi:hypothetical protein